MIAIVLYFLSRLNQEVVKVRFQSSPGTRTTKLPVTGHKLIEALSPGRVWRDSSPTPEMEMDSEEFQLESCPFIVQNDNDHDQNYNSNKTQTSTNTNGHDTGSAARKSQKRPEIDSDSGSEKDLDHGPADVSMSSSNNNNPKRLKLGHSSNSPSPVVHKQGDSSVNAYDLGLVDDDFSDEEIEVPVAPVSLSKGKSVPLAAPKPTVNVKYRRVLKLIPSNMPYVPISCPDGSRLYLRLLPETNPISLEPDPTDESRVLSEKELLDARKSNRTLLGINFEHLKKEAREIKDKFHEKIGELVGNNLTNLALAPTIVPGSGAPVPAQSQLFVDKYKPRGYMDLLSEETVNRSLMHWLKIWDNFVFGQDYLGKHKELRDRYSTLETKENESKFAWLNKKTHLVEDDAYDEFGRPKQKVAILYGPAGLGKTTAAHIIARHTGYSVMEMNASDDRSVEIFRKTLLQSTESKSEMFQDGRPNCLVIDEIDGAPAATVEVLVNLISGKTKEAGRNAKTKKPKILRRPIICICNDLFVPALKNLRTASTLVLQFNPISVASLVERIEEISLKENLLVDTGTLNLLAEKSDCDIRSCLSSLQFIKQHKNAESGGSGTTTNRSFLNSIGNQNKSKGIFTIWDEIFGLPQCKKYYFNSEDPTRTEVRFRNILKSVQNFGDYDKILGGIFENFLNVKFRDSYFQSILDTLEWTIWYDEIQSEIHSSQNYSLYSFLPVYFVVVHFLLASRTKVTLKYPNNMVFVRSTQHLNNFKAQLDGIPPCVGRFITMRDAILDIFPNLVGIIQPLTIRAIPSQLWSPRERETILNIVAIMMAYHLTYLQARNPDGNYTYQLEPNIEDLVKFALEDSPFKKQNFPYSIKQLIGREVEMEKLRTEDEQPGKIISSKTVDKQTKTEQQIPASSSASQNVQKSQPQLPKALPNSGAGDLISRDFFGRPIISKVSGGDSGIGNTGKNASGKSDIWFRFKEGYSNAVRKTLKLKDLI